MRKQTIISLLTIGAIYHLSIQAEIDMQKGVYDAAEEMMRFDEKMNRAIAEHNNLSMEDEDEMYLNSMVEDFEETNNGYLLKRNIVNHQNSKVNVELKEGLLSITITTTETQSEDFNNESNISMESTISSTTLSLFVPNDADTNQMQKNYHNGLLTITFPKK